MPPPLLLKSASSADPAGLASFVTLDGLENVRVQLMIRCGVNESWPYLHVGEIVRVLH
jgi:hypothetical protein